MREEWILDAVQHAVASAVEGALEPRASRPAGEAAEACEPSMTGNQLMTTLRKTRRTSRWGGEVAYLTLSCTWSAVTRET
mmetsp:Transcript_18030/g.54321  ORF Transcript_18030/g.54321 Transcript_18030/m.54321 type:complete len:80 (+) Transcript_18030:355-594(+)